MSITTTTTKAARPIYGAAVAISIFPSIATATAASYPYPTAVVAQGRAPATGDMGARPLLL